ncbi:DUF4214 domain-containing protein [Cellulomonas fimi]|uniref:DUF4214 domain-containing protein n=1 Tax=Cellulomonas fimi TaxID=1708 RepID=A0A7Y0M081_CELFI|nr:DUF4214 domain-containing protein [Cellulomonas fimi]NMR21385.1 DUF4214 domain-containing protein [Cellulomonas fimi]
MRSFTKDAGRPLRVAVLALSLVLLGGVTAPAQAAELPPGPVAPAPAPDPIDAYVRYEGQTVCDPVARPGTQYLLDLALSYYKIGRSLGIARNCAIGGQSEHKDGRAFDWGVSVSKPAEKAAGDAFVNWLTAPGPDGKVGYNARRLGVMYVIWNRQIFSNSSASAGWKPYTGAVPHTDHVHVSLGWNGAYMRTSWWTGSAVPAEADARRYVTGVYRDLFHRDPDPSGLTTWSTLLAAGTPLVSVANSITSSAEYRGGLIRGAYDEFLDREPDAGGLANWLDEMARGMTIQTMEGGFLASQEYYDQSGGQDAVWVQRLYQHVLRRAAGEAEVQHWLGQLAAGQSRQDVAMGFLLSTERLGTVVDGYYQDLLDRGIDPAGLTHWVGAIQTGTRTEAIIGGIVSSREYWMNAVPTRS